MSRLSAWQLMAGVPSEQTVPFVSHFTQKSFAFVAPHILFQRLNETAFVLIVDRPIK